MRSYKAITQIPRETSKSGASHIRNASPKRISTWLPVFGLFALVGGAAQGETNSAAGEPGFPVPMLASLAKGWNLVLLPTAPNLGAHTMGNGPAAQRLHVFPAVASEHLGPAEAVGPGDSKHGYWVFLPASFASLQALDADLGRMLPALPPQEGGQEDPPSESNALGSTALNAASSTTAHGAWRLVHVSEPIRPTDANIKHAVYWDAPSQSYATASQNESLQPNQGYWIRAPTGGAQSQPHGSEANSTGAEHVGSRTHPMPPKGLSAAFSKQTLRLWWEPSPFGIAPHAAPLGVTSYFRLYRDGVRIVQTEANHFRDDGLEVDRDYVYALTAVFKNEAGDELESVTTDPLHIRVPAQGVATAAGVFETPSTVRKSARFQALPNAALAEHDGRIFAHMAFVDRAHRAEGDRVQYLQSDRAGRPGSFTVPKTISSSSGNERVIDLAIAAQADHVAIVWIAYQHAPRGESSSQLFVSQSDDGGSSFSPPHLLRREGSTKRSLSLSFDALGGQHLVWAEGRKAYYLRDFSGEPSAVFDVRVRETTKERVQYLAYYPPRVGKACDCEDCWCEESYILGEKQSPDGSASPLAPYRDRIEEFEVSDPTLHVDTKTVTIIARQTRRWDNKPVIAPKWAAMLEHPIYDTKVSHGNQPTRFVVGWRKTWKRAFEPGDEAKWEAIGADFQFHYEGTVHNQHRILVAQRPVTEGASPQRIEPQAADDDPRNAVEWQQSASPNAVKQEWRLSVVDEIFEETAFQAPSHPVVYTAKSGHMIAAYEKGPSSSPNLPGNNPIYTASSIDGGKTWRPSVVSGARGYMPQLVSDDQDTWALFFYAPVDEGPAEIRVTQKGHEAAWSTPLTIADHRPRPLHRDSHDAEADSLGGEPTLVAHEGLFFAAWVEEGRDHEPGSRLVSARASNRLERDHFEIDLPDEVTEGKNIAVTVTAENRYFMRVDDDTSVRFTGSMGSPQGAKTLASPAQHSGAEGHTSSLLGGAAVSTTPQSQPVTLSQGTGTLWVNLAMVDPSAALFSPEWGSGLTETELLFEAVDQDHRETFGRQIRSVANHTGGNHHKALVERALLLRHLPGAASNGRDLYHQVEYQGDDESRHDGTVRDARYLADQERVWAYTQGIALAQYARQSRHFAREAQGIARTLCERAVWSGRQKILGWPFSWNTLDAWKDRRLVTGANAWVIQGLGVFMTSEAYQTLESTEEQESLKKCYFAALLGLQDHRRAVSLSTGRRVTLMTAGWSAAGLEHAESPGQLRVQSSSAELGLDENEQWAYYSILDGIGYDTFAPFDVATCTLGEACSRSPSTQAPWTSRTVESEDLWSLLRRRVPAENVVTEHNLDVLSVLNHALLHASELGIQDAPKLGDTKDASGQEAPFSSTLTLASLTEWRDEVRDGIFYGLWDDEGWKQEFETAIQAIDEDRTPKTARQAQRQQERKQALRAALASQELGRVVTGGVLAADGLGGFTFKGSPHTAIDNCSWLSLSVNYSALEAQGAEYSERLAKCLHYTILQYVKDLGFDDGCQPTRQSCPPKKSYPGAHYFQNTFKDPYIAPNLRQESSYHLEATMGLILGLYRFRSAHPEHAASEEFLMEANHLWAGAQAFVRDHGFPYSSQRIQDLSTLLSSSTAIIWFIDVYDHIHETNNDSNRPLQHYAAGADLSSVEPFLTAGLDEHKNLSAADIAAQEDVTTAAEISALDLLVATSEGDLTRAKSKAEVLVQLGDRESNASPEEALVWALPDSRRKLFVSMLALYAWTQFLDRFDGQDPAFEDPIRRLVEFGLEALASESLENGEGPWAGLFFRTPLDSGIEKRAALADNVLAFFALEGGVRTLRDPVAVDKTLARVNRLRTQLDELCGSTAQRPPWSFVFEGQEPSTSSDHDDFALCALFLAETGAYGAAADRLEATAYFDTTPKDPNLKDNPGAPSLFWGRAPSVLARRALAPLDARQDEMALLAFQAALIEPMTHTGRVAMLLAQDPGGAFGIEAGPLVVTDRLQAPRPQIDAERLPSVREGLANQLVETLAALMATEYRAYRFDALFHKVVRIRKAFDTIFGGVMPSLSYQDGLELVENELRFEMCRPEFLGHQGTVSLEDYLGLDCKTAGSLLNRLLDTRGGIEGELAMLLAKEDEEAKAFSLLLKSALAKSDPPGIVQATYGAAKKVPPIETSEPRSLLEWQQALRERLKDMVDLGLQDALSEASSFAYVLFGAQPQAYFHRASSTYWSREALELRAVLSSNAQEQIHFRVGQQRVEPPRLPLALEAKKNQRSLRQSVNETTEGRLIALAERAQVPSEMRVPWLTAFHRALRTGSLDAPTYETLGGEWLSSYESPNNGRQALAIATGLGHLLPPGQRRTAFSTRIDQFLQKDPDYAPSLENVTLAFGEIVDGLASGRFEKAGAPKEIVSEFGGRLVLAPSKLVSRFGTRTARWMDEVAKLPKEWTTLLFTGVQAATLLLSAQIDAGLETILVSGSAPSPEFWEPQGVVPSEDVAVQPIGSALKHEHEIRAQSGIYPSGPNLDSPLSNPPLPFEEHGIYLIQIDWLGVQMPQGHFGMLTPSRDALWPVFKLKTDRPRAEILQDFLKNHKFWKQFAPYAEHLPESRQDAFLFLIELMIRGEFNRYTAETFAGGNERTAGTPTDGGERGIQTPPHAPFFTKEGPPGAGTFAISGGRDGLDDVVVVRVPSIAKKTAGSEPWKRITNEDKEIIKKFVGQNPAHPWGSSGIGNGVMLRLYQSETAPEKALIPDGASPAAIQPVLEHLVETKIVHRTEAPVEYMMVPKHLHDVVVQDLEFFWKGAAGLEDALGTPTTSKSELLALRSRLETAWAPVSHVLRDPVARSIAYLVMHYHGLRATDLHDLVAPKATVEAALIELAKAGLLPTTTGDSTLTLNEWLLFQYHLDLHRFLYKRHNFAVESKPVDRIVLPTPSVLKPQETPGSPVLVRDVPVPPRQGVVQGASANLWDVGIFSTRSVRPAHGEAAHNLWNDKTSRIIFTFLYQVDRASLAEITLHNPTITSRKQLGPLREAGMISTETEGGTTYYRALPEKMHALQLAEIDFFWKNVPHHRSFFDPPAASFVERTVLADRLVDHWDQLTSALASAEARMFVSLLQFYGSLTRSEIPFEVSHSEGSFSQLVSAMVQAELISKTVLDKGEEQYTLNDELLYQYYYERQQFLWRMKLPTLPSRAPQSRYEPMPQEDLALLSKHVGIASRPMDAWWADKDKRSILTQLYQQDGLTASEIEDLVEVKDVRQTLDGLEEEGLILKKDDSRYSVQASRLHSKHQQDLQFFWGDASGLDAALKQPGFAQTDLEGSRRRLVHDWDDTIHALQWPLARWLVHYIARNGPTTIAFLVDKGRLPRKPFEDAVASLVRGGLVPFDPSSKSIHLNLEVLFRYTHELHRFLWRTEQHLAFYRSSRETPQDQRDTINPLPDTSERSKQDTPTNPQNASSGRSEEATKQVRRLLDRNQVQEWWQQIRLRRPYLSLYHLRLDSAATSVDRHPDIIPVSGKLKAFDLITHSTGNVGTRRTLPVTDVFHRHHYEELRLFWGDEKQFAKLFGSPPTDTLEQEKLRDRLINEWGNVAHGIGSDVQRAMIYFVSQNGPTSVKVLRSEVPVEDFDKALTSVRKSKLLIRAGVGDSAMLSFNEPLLHDYHKDLYRFLRRPINLNGAPVHPKSASMREAQELSNEDREFIEKELTQNGHPNTESSWAHNPAHLHTAVWSYYFGTSFSDEYFIPDLSAHLVARSLTALEGHGVVDLKMVQFVKEDMTTTPRRQSTINPEAMNAMDLGYKKFFWHDHHDVEVALGDPVKDREERELIAWRLTGGRDDVTAALQSPLGRVCAYILHRYGPKTPEKLAEWIGVVEQKVNEELQVLVHARLVHASETTGTYELDVDRLFRFTREWHQFLFRDPSKPETMPTPQVDTTAVDLSSSELNAVAKLQTPGEDETWWRQSPHRRKLIIYAYETKHTTLTLDHIVKDTGIAYATAYRTRDGLEERALMSVDQTVPQPHPFKLHPEKVRAHYMQELELFWGDPSTLQKTFGPAAKTSDEREPIRRRLLNQWTPAADALHLEAATAIIYLLHKHETLSDTQILKALATKVDLTTRRAAAKALEEAKLIEQQGSGKEAVYQIKREVLKNYHQDMYQFFGSL